MPLKSFNLIIKNKIFPFNKKIEVDADKSISIRSFLIGAISQNISKTKNILESEDVLSTINCLKILGVKIVKKAPKSYLIYGNGLGSLNAKKNAIRGKHAHKKISQIIICLSGEVEIICDDGLKKKKFILNKKNQCLIVPKLIWSILKYKSNLCN